LRADFLQSRSERCMTNDHVATAVGIANEHVKDIAPVVKATEVDE